MWSFAAIRPGNPPSLFIHSWYPLRVERDQLDLSVFGDIVDGSMIEPYLAEGPNAPDGTPRAYGFAEALGLPAFRWLSPRLVDVDPEHFLKHGGQRIGRKPPDMRSVLPPPTKHTLPKSGVSAREAFALLQPLLTPWFQPPWVLNQVSGSDLQGWEFNTFNPKTGEAILTYLFENGNAGCRSLGRQASLGSARALPESWLDSSAVLRIARALEPPPELASETLSRCLHLHWRVNPGGARWQVTVSATSHKHECPTWWIEINALTGAVVREQLDRRGAGESSWIMMPWRERLAGGQWQDIVKT